ncbi:MAG: hypothetical protein J0M26_19995 [Planctomycetes bacterium]|nr:hypothetical protein [Planctomycetota bacterium]
MKSRSVIGARKGISLIETLFAVGILMVGMLGIAAVLSVAGKNAVDSQTLASSQVLANSWLNDMYARNIQNPANWVRPVFNTTTNVWDWPSMGTASPQNSPNSSYCIDPLMFAFSPNISVANSRYTLTNFPYYDALANPLVDPSISAASGAGLNWGAVPRMLRVSVGTPGFPATGKLAEEIFASHNEIAEIKSRDSTRHVVRAFESVGTSLQKTATRQDYSWFATLTPKENNSSAYSSQYILSIVVVKKRDRVLDIPVPSAAGVGDPRALPSGEIMAWVVPLSTGSVPAGGFNGGGGGRVLLVGSAATESHTAAGQWIMLSRFDAALGRGVFSWYRIATCDQEARMMNVGAIPTEYGVSGFTLPFGAGNATLPVWVREVTLSGRDWGMYSAMGNASDSQVSIATIVDGAVNVHERVITLDEN